MADDTALVEERTTQLLDEFDPKTVPVEEFRTRRFDLGLAWISFPDGYGGWGCRPTFSGSSTGGCPRRGQRRWVPGSSSA